MNEYVQASVGQSLRQAREARGMTLDEAAARLRLMHRQIEAMEADDFETLGQPVFARGFVRNYARLLEIPADGLLEQMQGAVAEPAAVTRAEPPQARSWLSSPWLVLMMLGLLLVIAVPVGLYLWLNSAPDETAPSSPVIAQPRPAPAPATPAAPATPPAVAEAQAPATAVPDSPAAPAADVATGAAPAPAVAPAAAPPADAPPTAPATPVSTSGALHLEFGADAWTEIRDAQRRTLHRQLNRAGSSIDVQGQPPFAVVIGNAAQARLTYNGREVDLKPHIDVTVARFTLDD